MSGSGHGEANHDSRPSGLVVEDDSAFFEAEVKYHTLDLDGTKVKCCQRCYMLYGAPHKNCKTCLALNQRK